MSSSFASGFPDTVVLKEGVTKPRPVCPDGKSDGKSAPRSGKELPPRPGDPPAADPDATARALEQLAASTARELRFEVDVEHGETVIYVLDRATGELIRRIPRQELARIGTPDDPTGVRLLDERL
jgi:flagellar protein FlaG